MTERHAREHVPTRDVELSDLVIILAHDLKNALAALSANLHFLDGSTSASRDPDSVEALADSVTLCQVLDHSLRNLDLLGRYDSITAHKNLTSLRSIAQDAVGRLERQAKMGGVELLIDSTDGRDALAFVDRDLFLRATENIVANAVEHSLKGSRVRIVVSNADHESAITVIDTRMTDPPELLKTRTADGLPIQERHRSRDLGILSQTSRPAPGAESLNEADDQAPAAYA